MTYILIHLFILQIGDVQGNIKSKVSMAISITFGHGYYFFRHFSNIQKLF